MKKVLLAIAMLFVVNSCGKNSDCLRGECKIRTVVETIVDTSGDVTTVTPINTDDVVNVPVAVNGGLELNIVCPNVIEVLILRGENGASLGTFSGDAVAQGKKIIVDPIPVGYYDVYFKRDNGSEDSQHLLVTEGITTTTCEKQ